MIITKVLGYSFHHYQTKEGCNPLFFFLYSGDISLHVTNIPKITVEENWDAPVEESSFHIICKAVKKNPQGVITPVKAKLCLRPLRDQLLVGALSNKCVGRSEFQTLAVGWVCWGLLVAVGMACRGSVYMAPRNWSAMRPASRSPLRRAPWTVAG